ENLAGFVNRGKEAVLLVPIPALDELDATLVSGELVHPPSQVCNPDLPGRGEIDRLSDGLLIMGARDESVDDVTYISEVSRLFARACDRQSLPVHGPEEEVRDDVAVLSWHLTWPEGIEESGIHDGEIVQAVEHARVKLAQHLGNLVGRVEVCGDILLGERHGSVRPVDAAAGRGIDEALDAGGVGVFEDFQGAETVYREVEFWVVDRILVREVGGEVVND